MSRYALFDMKRVELKPLAERGHQLLACDCLSLKLSHRYQHPEFPLFIEAIIRARQLGRPIIVMMGAHPIKLGLSAYLIDLMRNGWITHLATNGAGIIHDFELACACGTSEDVAQWIRVGQFGLWAETAELNDIVKIAARSGEGLGEAVGRVITERHFPATHLSLTAAGWQLGIPVTCHVSIGSDIVHAHPNCDGAAWGQASYTDFLIFAESIRKLEDGVFMNIGSAVTGPEVYLKALSIARNVARNDGYTIQNFTTAVFDLLPVPENYHQGPPAKDQPLYYYRPWKTILVRTVADGGRSFYFQGDHQHTIPTLWSELTQNSSACAKAA